MKKIITLLIISIFLVSCGDKVEHKQEINKDIKNSTKIESYKDIISPLDNRVKKSFEFNDCMQQASLNCAEQASYQIAKKTGDIGICNKIQDKNFKQSCIDNANYLIALDKQDYKLCKNIKNKIVKKNCTDELLYKQAIKNKDISYCNNSPMGQLKEDCINEFYYTIAQKEKDKSYCEKINDKLMKEGCIGESSTINKIETNSGFITK